MIQEDIRNNVVSFLQELVEKAGLPLEISRITCRMQAPKSAELDWDWAFEYLNEETHFDLAIGIKIDDDIDGMAVGIYCDENEILEVQAVESFVRLDEDHPLKGKMVLLTLIAAIYFVLQAEGKGVHVVAPEIDLINYYEKFSLTFKQNHNGEPSPRMTGNIEELSQNLTNMIDGLA
ncbi:Putative uncharacterized protein [Moritella viscosa]|uniref:hypothetical protein n=1 Tax=Moritella viscosa TaxID=80854 RepID=UPI00091BC737|nr:hypothetical protein [Moritella viscosa]SHO23789.1 Putative uncharacterized protein [Moritella viscosa]